MSELNVYHHELRHNEYDEFYLKSEADRYIAHIQRKRCEAMARWMLDASCPTDKDLFVWIAWNDRWRNRWEKLAEHYRMMENV